MPWYRESGLHMGRRGRSVRFSRLVDVPRALICTHDLPTLTYSFPVPLRLHYVNLRVTPVLQNACGYLHQEDTKAGAALLTTLPFVEKCCGPRRPRT